MPDHPGHERSPLMPASTPAGRGPPEGTLTATIAAPTRGALMRPSLNILDAELTSRIVDEAMRVLAEVGMEIRGPEMRRRLLEHGLPLDHGGERVLFPRDVVEAAIASAPGSFVLFDRAGEPHADLGGDRVHFVPGSSGLKVLDHRTGETRLAELDRLRRVRPAGRRARQHPVPRHGVLDQR